MKLSTSKATVEAVDVCRRNNWFWTGWSCLIRPDDWQCTSGKRFILRDVQVAWCIIRVWKATYSISSLRRKVYAGCSWCITGWARRHWMLRRNNSKIVTMIRLTGSIVNTCTTWPAEKLIHIITSETALTYTHAGVSYLILKYQFQALEPVMQPLVFILA